MHKIIRARNVQEAYFHGLKYLRKRGAVEDSRAGPVMVAPGPVMTEYARPLERVLVDGLRDANPFFHLMEAMWMLAGRNDVESIQYYNSRMSYFSDDGVAFNAAYGHRWRRFFGTDQIVNAVEQLRADPTTRRTVIQMWKGGEDGMGKSKDYPCNTACFFRAHRWRGTGNWVLDMTITNRSNDVIWGAYGANAVHMSVLHEFVAAMAGMITGKMYQLSNNYHAYLDVLGKVGEPSSAAAHAYSRSLSPTPLFKRWPFRPPANVLAAVEGWWDDDTEGNWVDVLTEVMTPEGWHTINQVRASWRAWKGVGPHPRDRMLALEIADKIPGEDWARACTEWLHRRRGAAHANSM